MSHLELLGNQILLHILKTFFVKNLVSPQIHHMNAVYILRKNEKLFTVIWKFLKKSLALPTLAALQNIARNNSKYCNKFGVHYSSLTPSDLDLNLNER